ncbi:MAG: immunoglobulin domain-containing protein [Chitinispirillaceae bacterium]|nr:immunoglobulin domain-containing protein [Chitinispirillaceae bacterium]
MARYLIIIVGAFLLTLTCNDLPNDPFAPENARVSLVLQNSDFTTSDTAVTDTTGNKVRIGVCLFLTQHIDSTEVIVSQSGALPDTTFLLIKKGKAIDTAFFDMVFTHAGVRTVKATGYVGKELRRATATITIVDRPEPNHAPELTITGSRTVVAGQTCRLTVKAIDPDPGQTVTLQASGIPAAATFSDTTFVWQTTPADSGTHTVTFVARDNGTPVLSDFEEVVISVTATVPQDTTPPTLRRLTPADDSISINASSITIRVIATDASGISRVTCALGSDTFSVTRSADSVFSATVTGLVVNLWSRITVIATDSSLAANRCTLSVFIKYDPTMLDSAGPVIFQKSGPTSGSVIISPIVSIIDSIVDQSGIDSVYWTLNNVRAGAMTLVSSSTTNYRLLDTLTTFRANRIVVHVVDRSTRRNRDSAIVQLDYNLPPISNDTAVSTNRNIAKTWTLNFNSQDGDPLTWSQLTSPSSLSGAVSGTLPSVTFTPASNWSGVDSFLVRVSDGYWSDTIKIKITVVNVTVAPSIVTQPQSLTRNIGQSATFSVTINADVNPEPSYQWKKNGAEIFGANAASFSIIAVAVDDSGSYNVTVSNGAGTVTSQPVLLTIQYAPFITSQPQSQILYLGQPVTFSVTARGNPAPTYQWLKSGNPIPSATRFSYSISNPGINDSGVYSVRVMNLVDTMFSDTVGFYATALDVAAGGNHTLFLLTDGRLFACGDSRNGQFGLEPEDEYSIPVLIMTEVKNVAAGGGHTLMIKTNRTLWACGFNIYGQLGDGTTNNRQMPVLVANEVLAVGGGDLHSLFHKSDNSLWSCGYNMYGQLGNGSSLDTANPVFVGSNVNSFDSRFYHTIIVRTDGIVLGCGHNSNGQLGTGDTIRLLVPVQIASNGLAVSTGSAHSLILKTDSTLWACGANGFGQLCNGTKIDQTTPVRVMDGVRSMSAGGFFSLVLKGDGTLWACGKNDHGQLGDGTKSDRVNPVHIMSGVKKAVAGYDYSLVIKTDGTVWGFGCNSSNKFGEKNWTTDHPSPVEITF